jgi:hypothetical protein
MQRLNLTAVIGQADLGTVNQLISCHEVKAFAPSFQAPICFSGKSGLRQEGS